mmetsp:Transcript_69210/g.202661  ORF Transcript_69210/g.202661 Transcript_69210/m.202661 type:complete len:245 (+) Transcript_69210:25-759(+)
MPESQMMAAERMHAGPAPALSPSSSSSAACAHSPAIAQGAMLPRQPPAGRGCAPWTACHHWTCRPTACLGDDERQRANAPCHPLGGGRADSPLRDDAGSPKLLGGRARARQGQHVDLPPDLLSQDCRVLVPNRWLVQGQSGAGRLVRGCSSRARRPLCMWSCLHLSTCLPLPGAAGVQPPPARRCPPRRASRSGAGPLAKVRFALVGGLFDAWWWRGSRPSGFSAPLLHLWAESHGHLRRHSRW